MTSLMTIGTQTFHGKTINIYGNIENPLFLAQDVAIWIEHSNVSAMLNSVNSAEKLLIKGCLNNACTPPTGGENEHTERWFLTEEGLYEVLMLSRKPLAKEFKKKIKEMLKSIRQTGQYKIAPQQTPTIVEPFYPNPELILLRWRPGKPAPCIVAENLYIYLDIPKGFYTATIQKIMTEHNLRRGVDFTFIDHEANDILGEDGWIDAYSDILLSIPASITVLKHLSGKNGPTSNGNIVQLGIEGLEYLEMVQREVERRHVPAPVSAATTPPVFQGGKINDAMILAAMQELQRRASVAMQAAEEYVESKSDAIAVGEALRDTTTLFLIRDFVGMTKRTPKPWTERKFREQLIKDKYIFTKPTGRGKIEYIAGATTGNNRNFVTNVFETIQTGKRKVTRKTLKLYGRGCEHYLCRYCELQRPDAQQIVQDAINSINSTQIEPHKQIALESTPVLLEQDQSKKKARTKKKSF